jgi:MmyB-like transcription regulator ligand binding domain
VAFLRRDSAHDLDDPQLAELIGELSLKSPSFRRWWNSREVKDKASGSKRFNHPLVGELELRYETLYPGGSENQALVSTWPSKARPRTPASTCLRRSPARETRKKRRTSGSTPIADGSFRTSDSHETSVSTIWRYNE